MHSIFPTEEIEKQLGKQILVLQKGMDHYVELVQTEGSMRGLALSVWNRIIEVEKLPYEPYQISSHIDENGQPLPSLLGAISKIIKQPVVKDISVTYAKVDDPQLQDTAVGDLIIAHVFPNDLHIADVCFMNPYRPIPSSHPSFSTRYYYGYKLLGPTLERIERKARQLGCNNITLTCAAPDLVAMFAKHGFQKENGRLGKAANAMDKRL